MAGRVVFLGLVSFEPKESPPHKGKGREGGGHNKSDSYATLCLVNGGCISPHYFDENPHGLSREALAQEAEKLQQNGGAELSQMEA